MVRETLYFMMFIAIHFYETRKKIEKYFSTVFGCHALQILMQ